MKEAETPACVLLLLDQARVTNQPSMTASPMTIQNA